MNDQVAPLSDDAIRKLLRADLKDIPIFCYDSIDSTNRQAKLCAEQGRVGCALFAANSQTAGRGRLGRNFYSPADTGIYFSFLFSSDASLMTLSAVTPAAAVATASLLEALNGRTVGIKWVNDLYLGNKKICGILTEAVSAVKEHPYNKIIVGIGINLSTADFPKELEEIAGSLGCTVDRNALIAGIVNRLYDFVLNPEGREYIGEYTARSIVIGKKVKLIRGEEDIEGTVLGFDENGGLLLDVGDGIPHLFTGGEISLRFL